MDPYKVLGLSRDVSDQRVRKAYRLLALKLHPDRNRTNKEHYQQQFVELQEAYNCILAERERRAKCAGTSSSSTPPSSASSPRTPPSEFEESSASSESNFSSSSSDSGDSATSEESSSSYSSSYSSTSSSCYSSTTSATSASPSAGGNDAKAESRSSHPPESDTYKSGSASTSSSRTASPSAPQRKSNSKQSSSSKSHSSRSPSPRREVNKEGRHGRHSGSSNHERGRHHTREKSQSRTRSRSVMNKPSDENSHHCHHRRSSRHGDHGSDKKHRHQEKDSRHSRGSRSPTHSHVKDDHTRDKRNGREKNKKDRSISKDKDRDGGKGKDRHGHSRKNEEDPQSSHRRHRHKHHHKRHSRSRSGSREGARSRSHGNERRGTSADKTKKGQSGKQSRSRSREKSPHRSRRHRPRDNSALGHHERDGEEKPSRASSTTRHSAHYSDHERDYGSTNLSRKPTQQRWGRNRKGDQENNGIHTSTPPGTEHHDANPFHSRSRGSSPSRTFAPSAKGSEPVGDADVDETYEFVNINPTEAIPTPPANSQRGKLRKQNKQSPPKRDHDTISAAASSSHGKHDALDEEAQAKTKDKSSSHANSEPALLTDYAYPLPDGVLDAREWTHTLPLSLNELFSGKQISFRFSRYKLSGKKKSVVLDVIIPPGCHHGTKILFRNAGHERSDGTKQDVVFRIEEVEHERFVRAKDDLYLNMKLPWVDSLREEPGEVYVDGIDGKEYMFQINWRRDHGLDGTHTVSRGGMPRKDGKGRGKLIVNWEVGDPPQSTWDTFKEAFGFKSSG